MKLSWVTISAYINLVKNSSNLQDEQITMMSPNLSILVFPTLFRKKKIIYSHWYFNFLATNCFSVWKQTIFYNWWLRIAVITLSWPLHTFSSQKMLLFLCRKMQVMSLFCSSLQKSYGKQHVLLKNICYYQNARLHSFGHLKPQFCFHCYLKEYTYTERVLFLLILPTHSKSHNPAFKEIILCP